jgi:hypothetical protein
VSRAGRAPGHPPESRCLQDTPHTHLGSGPQGRTHPHPGSNLQHRSGGVDIVGTVSAWAVLRTATVLAASENRTCVCAAAAKVTCTQRVFAAIHPPHCTADCCCCGIMWQVCSMCLLQLLFNNHTARLRCVMHSPHLLCPAPRVVVPVGQGLQGLLPPGEYWFTGHS